MSRPKDAWTSADSVHALGQRRTLTVTGPDGVGVTCERFEAELPLAAFAHGPEVKEACGTCPHRGRNFSCPPRSPVFPDYVRGVPRALLVCLRLPLAAFGGADAEERCRAGFRTARGLLVEELLRARGEGHVVAGSGACLACGTCAAEQGETECPRPELRIFSLESLGVDVVALLRSGLGIDLEWTAGGRQAGSVCAAGAVFFGGAGETTAWTARRPTA